MTGRNNNNSGAPGRGFRVLGISLAVLNLLLWYCTPAIRAFVDDWTGRWANADNPRIVTGVQELLVYFDPWLARGVFPVVYTLGFAVIPFLRNSGDGRTVPRRIYAMAVSLLLIAFEAVWFLLIAVEVFLRGPNWTIFWPGEQWDEHKLAVLNNVNLSEYFWLVMMRRPMGGMSWAWREMPGLVLLGSYLLAGIVFAYACFRAEHRVTPFWRWATLVLLLQLPALIPMKMMCRWLFHIKYWISVPEFFWNV